MVNEMTSGRPIRVITTFAIPMFIGSIFQQIYNMVDSIVVGNFVGAEALAAVGACTGAFNLMLALITGLTNGMSVVTAQYFGARNDELVKRTFITSMSVSMAVGVVISIAGIFLARPLLLVLGTPNNIIDDAQTYLTIMFIGTLANCLYNGMAAVLRALGNSMVPLVSLIIASLLNVVLDLLFVLQFDMAVAGVAIATVLSQLISGLVCVVYVYKKVPILKIGRGDFGLDKNITYEIMRIGFPAALSSCGVSISVMFMQRAINAYGSDVIAAYTVGSRAENVGMALAFSIGSAVGTFCGQNIGARDFERVRKGMHAGYILALTYACVMGAVMIIFARPLAGLFTTEKEVVDIAIGYVYVASTFAPVLGLVFIFQNFLRSAGDVMPTVWMSVMEILARSVLAFLFSYLFGYAGIWWATPIGWTASLLLGYLRYRSGVWRRRIEKLDGAVIQENT